MSRSKALIYLIIASILWSIGGLFIKLINCSPFVISGTRSLIAFIIIFLFSGRKSFKKIKLSKMFIVGVISYAMLVVCFVGATKLTTAANAIMLQFTAPIWLPIISYILFREKTSKKDLVIISIIFGGILMFFLGQLQAGDMTGNFIAIISGISMAMLIIAMKHPSVDAVQVTLFGNLFIFILSIPAVMQTQFSTNDVKYILILGIFQLGIPYVFYTAAIKYVSTVEAILIPILEPLLNPVWVMIFAGEKPSFYSLIGGLIILVTITYRTFDESKSIKKDCSQLEF